MPANSSMATSLLTIASLRARSRAPTAIVTDSTVGMATGMAATVSTRANSSTGCRPGAAWSIASPRNSETVTISTTSTAAIRMR